MIKTEQENPDIAACGFNGEDLHEVELALSCDILDILIRLAALKDYLGSFNPSVLFVCEVAKYAEREQPGVLFRHLEEIVSLMEICKSKLVGQLDFGLLEDTVERAAKSTVYVISRLLHIVDEIHLDPQPIRLFPSQLIPLYLDEE